MLRVTSNGGGGVSGSSIVAGCAVTVGLALASSSTSETRVVLLPSFVRHDRSFIVRRIHESIKQTIRSAGLDCGMDLWHLRFRNLITVSFCGPCFAT